MSTLSNRRHAFLSSDLGGVAILGLCAVVTVWGWGSRRLASHHDWMGSTASQQSESDDASPSRDGSPRRTPAPQTFVNSLGIRLVLIPRGEFMMGSPAHEEIRRANESQHRVRITRPFYLGAHEVSVGQFRRFVEETGYRTEAEASPEKNTVLDVIFLAAPPGEILSWRNPGFAQKDDHPVVYVSWPDAVAFCQWLSAKEGRDYRLPTEAEWEYACRAGTTTRFGCGQAETDLFRAANVKHMIRADNGGIRCLPGANQFTVPVGRFEPNAFGLYDMHGNAWEWCADRYDRDYYLRSPTNDPTGPSTGECRLVRGGSFRFSPWHARAAYRYSHVASRSIRDVGFRVVADTR